MEINEALNILEEMAECFYQEKTASGMEKLESVVTICFQLFEEENNPVIGVMDAIDHGDYIAAADRLHHDIVVPVRAMIKDEKPEGKPPRKADRKFREKNRDAMRRFFPELYDRYSSLSEKERQDAGLSGTDWIDTRRGGEKAVILSMTDGRMIRLNSDYDPVYEASVWFEGQEEPKGSYILIFGIGNGMFAKEILRHTPEDTPVLIYEPSKKIFYEAMQNADLSVFFSSRIRVIVEGINEDLFMAVMETFLTHENYEDYQIYLTPRYEEAFPESRERFVRHLAADGIGWMRDIRNTIREEIHISPYNTLYNLRFLETGTVVPRLKGVIPRDVPVLLVGAGPSLKGDIDTIKKYRDLVYIFAADDICSYLLENGITPDAFCCVEADKSLSYYKDERMRDIPLFTKINSSYKLMDWHRSEKVFGYDEGFMENYYEKYRVPKSEFRYGGNTMTALFSICDELGVETVMLVGQDMCFGADGGTHADTTEGDRVDESGSFTCINNQGKEVKTRYDWFTFLRWYESAIYDCGMKRVINTALEGARVNGATVMPLKEAVQNYGKKNDGFRSVLEKAPGTYDGLKMPDLRQVYEELEVELIELEKIVSDDPKSKKRRQYMLYELLKRYEIADLKEDFKASQGDGISCLRRFLNELKRGIKSEK